MLGGLLTGPVLIYLRLDDPRWYANARTYLMAIPSLMAVVLLVLAVTGNRLLGRTMQLALVLCIVFHIVFVMAALHTDVFRQAWTEVLVATRPPPRGRR